MNFKCNHCERPINYRYFGEETIKCSGCGAKYTKTVVVEIKEK